MLLLFFLKKLEGISPVRGDGSLACLPSYSPACNGCCFVGDDIENGLNVQSPSVALVQLRQMLSRCCPGASDVHTDYRCFYDLITLSLYLYCSAVSREFQFVSFTLSSHHFFLFVTFNSHVENKITSKKSFFFFTTLYTKTKQKSSNIFRYR